MINFKVRGLGLKVKSIWRVHRTSSLSYFGLLYLLKNFVLKDWLKFYRKFSKWIFNSKLTLGQSTLKNWTNKWKAQEESINSAQFLKIKCLKPIYFSQHHKEAKYQLNCKFQTYSIFCDYLFVWVNQKVPILLQFKVTYDIQNFTWLNYVFNTFRNTTKR